ncbi:Ig-like domain-containing protein [Oceanihabitans sp. 1_MG-2023]|uniref:Ig-like domain-containing protein n=1 Tax=Flavobacteriaceae TaxID=49546 RepID=UPI002090D2F0|nr:MULTISPECIES: Ig-like domain-containing protein [Flavobacteriaceae]MDO6624156.1 Ig-like domain-containing protein [Oceanihabitans sp. 1_MG-2023]
MKLIMRNKLSNLFFILTIGLILISCANRGNPSGGPKDITAPKIVKSIPQNYTTNFNGKEIKIYFDEYVKIKNLTKQLIISPPMDPSPEVTPLGTASKYITIKINDTLLENTTYAFNFGNSIVDNNEENPYSYYKFVFSTGNYIDSLSVKGDILDASLRKPEDFVSVRLYEIDSTFSDSIVYKKLPKYVTNTLDSTTTFSIDNIKAGKYMLVALKDANEDNKFQQLTDKIGFYKDYITVPTDSTYSLKLFKEEADFSIIRPRLVAGEKIAFGYQGDYKNTAINITSVVPDTFKYTITKDAQTDSLNYWYSPRLKDTDSLLFTVKNNKYTKDFTVKISDQPRDSLKIEASKGTLNFKDNFKITANIPLTNFNEKKLTILDKDSLQVAYTTVLDTLKNTYSLIFDKTENNKYFVQVLPEAFTDFFNNKNDSLNYTLSTRNFADYGNVRVTLYNAKYPIIAQLTDAKGELKAEIYSTQPEPLDFRYLDPAKYYLRIIYDTNKNKKYDSGNYLKKRQPERISHFKEAIEVRANWDPIIDFTLLD